MEKKLNKIPIDKWDLNLDDWFNTNALGSPQVHVTTTPPLFSIIVDDSFG